jgi:hypothetical protein
MSEWTEFDTAVVRLLFRWLALFFIIGLIRHIVLIIAELVKGADIYG